MFGAQRYEKREPEFYLFLANQNFIYMLKYLLLNFVFLSSLFLNAQPLLKHQGKLQNGFTDAGDVTYTYRMDDKTREHIKHGTFRYTVKAREDQSRFNHYITGSFIDNLKDGTWSYKINQKDFRLQDRRLYTTGTVSLDASYTKGVPNGKWRYETALRNREGEKKQDRWTWGRYDTVRTVIVELNFTNGIITGPFYAKVEKEFEISGNFDENGFFHGEWIWSYPDSITTITWDHGIESGTVINDGEDNILHIEQHSHSINIIREYQLLAAQGSEKIRDYPFSLDTVSLLSNSRYQLTGLLQNTVYHPQYFLHRQIGGDKTLYYDTQSYRMQQTIEGMYVINQKNRISATQVQHHNRIEVLIKRMETQMAYIYQMRRDGKLKRQAGEAIRLMEHNISQARKYACTGETLKLHLSLQDGLNAASVSCAYLGAFSEPLPGFRTKEAALQHFVEKISALEKENHTQYNNIRKNMVL